MNLSRKRGEIGYFLSKNPTFQAVEEVWAGRSEREVAREVAMRRLEAYRGLDETTVRRRLKGYLDRRGFPHGDIVEVVRELTSRKVPPASLK